MQSDTPVKPVPMTAQTSDQSGPTAERNKTEPDANHGEGNPDAAARFNKAEQDFVNSPRGQAKIREAGNVSPDEQAQLDEAERTTRSLPTDVPSKNP